MNVTMIIIKLCWGVMTDEEIRGKGRVLTMVICSMGMITGCPAQVSCSVFCICICICICILYFVDEFVFDFVFVY